MIWALAFETIMITEPFIQIAYYEESSRFFFLGLASELNASKQSYSYDEPHYHDRNFGISIVATYVSSNTYSYLELCIISMGYKPIPEAGPIRVVMFQSQEEKEAFRLKFDACFKVALNDLNKLSGMNPADYYRMVCFTKFDDNHDDAQSHSIMLTIDTKSELSRVLWYEHLKEKSDFPGELPQYFNECVSYNQVLVKFRRAKSRDRYARQLNEKRERFTEACKLHGSLFHAIKS